FAISNGNSERGNKRMIPRPSPPSSAGGEKNHRNGAAPDDPTGGRPQPLPVVAENIPDALKEIPHWLVWKYVEEVDRETGEVGWDKPPVNARNGRPGSSTNPATWTTFDEAHDAYTELGYDGVGFVLSHNGEDRRTVGIDLD